MKSLTGINHYIWLPLLLLLILFPMHSVTSQTFWINLIVELSKDILGNLQSSDTRGMCFQVSRQLSPRIFPMAGLVSREAAIVLFLCSKNVQEMKELVPKICPKILEDDRANHMFLNWRQNSRDSIAHCGSWNAGCVNQDKNTDSQSLTELRLTHKTWESLLFSA